MSRRTISKHMAHAHVVMVTYESDLREYRARIDRDPKSDYFTDDKQDALDTASAMLTHACKHD